MVTTFCQVLLRLSPRGVLYKAQLDGLHTADNHYCVVFLTIVNTWCCVSKQVKGLQVHSPKSQIASCLFLMERSTHTLPFFAPYNLCYPPVTTLVSMFAGQMADVSAAQNHPGWGILIKHSSGADSLNDRLAYIKLMRMFPLLPACPLLSSLLLAAQSLNLSFLRI